MFIKILLLILRKRAGHLSYPAYQFRQEATLMLTSELRSDAKKPCFAIKVRTRSEEYVGTLLRQKDFRVLVPSFTRLVRYSDRASKVTLALFPGYLFVRMESRDLSRLLSTDGVSYVVPSGRGHEPLPQHETRAIEALCESAEFREPCSPLRIGRRVRIESGPFIGVEGVLANVQNSRRLVISVESLCSSVSIEIAGDHIRPVDDRDVRVAYHPGSRRLADERLPV